MTRRSQFLLCSALALLLSAPALAAPEAVKLVNDAPATINLPAPPDKLTEEGLKAFYDESKKIHLKSFEEYQNFMSAHVRDDVQFTLAMVNHIPSQPDQKQTLIMNKKKFEDSLKENYTMSQGADIQHSVVDMYISADGKTANVRDMTTMSKVVAMQSEGKVIKVEVQSQSTCDDILTLSDKGLPQIHQSTCNAENYFYPQK
jgi:hypothetical protein